MSSRRIAPRSVCLIQKTGVFSRGRLGIALGSAAFLEAGLAAIFFVPAVFAPLALVVEAAALGFRAITVNSSSFPQ
jgi:tetrahydromethanopterin S-methyltransferase subunit C